LTNERSRAVAGLGVVDGTLIASFDKADLDNNIPGRHCGSLTVSGLFLNGGVQKRLTATANVRVIK
jgi:hypothetical protein